MRVGIELGKTATGEPLLMDLEELLSTRLLVQGNSGSGKSHLLRRLLEQSAPHVQQAIVDPEGDFVSFADRYGHVIVDAERSPADLARIAANIRRHRASAVLNLEGLDAEDQMRCAAAFLNGLFDAERDHWYPMLIAVDEAQLFAPAVAGEVADDARKASLGAMTNLMCRGRKRGLAGIIATQRLAKLAKNVAAEASNFLMGRTFLDIDMMRAADLLGMERRQAEAFRDLHSGQFCALGPALTRRPLEVRIGPVETSSRNGRPSLMPLPEARGEDLAALVFDPGAQDLPAPMPAAPPRPRTSELLQRVAGARPAGFRPVAERVEEPEDPRTPEEREAILSAIYQEILADPETAFRPIATAYQDFLYHCRMQRLEHEAPDMATFRRRLALGRAGISEADGDEAWQQVTAMADGLPEDMQGVFLLVARAARDEAPCPSDEILARSYGSHSPSRGRWLLGYMAERGLIRQEVDFRGNRTVVVAGVGWRTQSAHPRGLPARPMRERRRAE